MIRLFIASILVMAFFQSFASKAQFDDMAKAEAEAKAEGSGSSHRSTYGSRRAALERDRASDYSSSSSGTYSGDTLVLEREYDGHFYADVDVNNRTLRMMVDTGASTIALTTDDARRAGITVSPSMNMAVGEGAGGTVYGDVTNLDSVRLGRVTANDLPAVVIKGGSQSLLGQSFLRQFRSVNIEGDQMVLRS